MINAISESARSVVDALKEQPATFAMIVMSFGLLFFVWYISSAFNAQQLEMSKLMLAHQGETQQILSRCIEPLQVQTIIDQLGRDRASYSDQLNRNFNQSSENHQALGQILELLKKPVEQR